MSQRDVFPSVKRKLTPRQLLSHLQQSAAAEQKEQSSTCRIRSHWSTRLTQMWFSGWRRSLPLRDWVKAESRRSSSCVLSFPASAFIVQGRRWRFLQRVFLGFSQWKFLLFGTKQTAGNRERITSCVPENISKKRASRQRVFTAASGNWTWWFSDAAYQCAHMRFH